NLKRLKKQKAKQSTELHQNSTVLVNKKSFKSRIHINSNFRIYKRGTFVPLFYSYNIDCFFFGV
ncbi:hypothetical protein IJD15_01990, partial [bacterium]|nr:hypothetical protein [bacterium]